MYQYNEKVNDFANTIYKKAVREKQHIIQRAEKYREKVLKEKELEFLEKAYSSIQQGLKKIDNEKNEIISKAIMDGKKRVLKRREEITNSVVSKTIDKLMEYKRTNSYKEYLFQVIEKDILLIGEGDVEVFISNEDKDLLEELNRKFSNTIKLKEDDEGMLGGCIVINHTNNKYLNDTFGEKLAKLRDEFMVEMNISL